MLPNSEIEQFVNLLPAIIWHANPNSLAFEYVSMEAEALLGYPVEDWIGKPTFWADHLHPEDRDWAVSFCKSAVAAGRPHEFEYRMLARDGRIVWVRDLVRTIVTPGGTSRVVGIMIDVTRRYQSERDRQSFEAQIHRATQVEALIEVTARVAHDFNNMLTVISMHADLIKNSESISRSALESLDAIAMALGQGMDLTKSLLAVSRDTPAEKKVINLREVVEQARRMIGRVVPREIDLVIENQADSPLWINGDAAKIHQLLLSLILDARNSMLDGGKLIVSLHGVEMGEVVATKGNKDKLARLTVSGCNDCDPTGHAPGEIELPPITSESPWATAQNYPIVAEIVEDHEGLFHVETTQLGSMLQVDIPCVSPPTDAQASEEQATNPAASRPLIVIVEEDQQIREITASVLQDAGYEVAPLRDRTELERHLDQRHGDVGLFLIDSSLANGGALGFIKSIRAQGQHTPCIVMANCDGVDEQTGFESPNALDSVSIQPIKMLQKPFPMRSLIDSVKDLLAHGGAEKS